MASSEKLLPLTLPSWPTCDDCISWSEDDIAVTGGDSVHIITPKSQTAHFDAVGHPQWRILTVRVNLFTRDEWPEQNLATISDLSIGEEQSNSHAVSLAWSYSGLGLHKRCVLAVLTSNLLLSLWETDGSRAAYQRTCIVNDFMGEGTKEMNEGEARRALRVRSFTWLPVLKNSSTSKWGLHHLAVADDRNIITILRVSKTNTAKLGCWSLEMVLRCGLVDLDSSSATIEYMSPLQKRLVEQCPITKMTSTPWHTTRMLSGKSPEEERPHREEEVLVCEMIILKGSFGMHKTCLWGQVSEDSKKASIDIWKTLQNRGYSASQVEHDKSFLQTPIDDLDHNTVQRLANLEAAFKETLKPIRETFDTTFGLSGHLRTRFWGSATSADGTKAVACITLHPSDMIEYNIPSAERSTLVFRYTGRKQSVSSSDLPKSAAQVQKDILNYVCSKLSGDRVLESTFDKQLLNAYHSLATTVFGLTSEMMSTLQTIRDNMQAESETCDVCDDAITFTEDTQTCNCKSGHRFSRCQLSFLAIQEPGISKYCSQCSKQFLDLTKLGAADGSSFAHAVFDDFDICPYCQAKFRS